jgi:hypothetical protein
MWPFLYSEETVGIPRELFSRALQAEGIPHGVGYVAPLYLLPVFQRRLALGSDGFPFSLRPRDYQAGLCPVTERMHNHELMLFEICAYDTAGDFVDAAISGVRKVYAARDELSLEP